MGAMALVKILSATTGRGSTLAKVAGTLLGGSGGGRGSGKSSGSGRGGGRGSSDGSLAESLLDAVKELKKGGMEAGSGGSGRRQGKGRQSASGTPAPQASGVESRADEPGLNTDTNTDADQLALATLAEHITSFVDGRARVRHAGLASREAASALQTLLAANGLAASFSPRGSSVLITYDATSLDKSGFLLRALPLGRYLRDCDAALEARA